MPILLTWLKVILAYDNSGPDILALQEVENLNILTQLFNLLEPHGYKDLMLIQLMIMRYRYSIHK